MLRRTEAALLHHFAWSSVPAPVQDLASRIKLPYDRRVGLPTLQDAVGIAVRCWRDRYIQCMDPGANYSQVLPESMWPEDELNAMINCHSVVPDGRGGWRAA